jgi:hypothetical protein
MVDSTSSNGAFSIAKQARLLMDSGLYDPEALYCYLINVYKGRYQAVRKAIHIAKSSIHKEI